jgi:tRNA(Arg) A34 adenosine deaminase TadA
MKSHSEILVRQPAWLDRELAGGRVVMRSRNARMRFVVSLAARNVAERSGGPFAAAVFEGGSGKLLAAAVNRVVPEGVSLAHAEMLAISLAQRRTGSYDLGRDGRSRRELVTSTEPCAMCLGAIPWSGVRRLVCGARAADAALAGFDEGDKPPRWREGLKRRGIAVDTDVCRAEAAAVLMRYRETGGGAYNGRGGRAAR